MLRQLSSERPVIRDAMCFALDHADDAKEVRTSTRTLCSSLQCFDFVHLTQIVQILADSLTLAETPIPKKISRLFVLSDILHNSNAPVRNASSYRTE